MSSNEVVLLNKVLNQQRDQYGESLSDARFFEIFTADQILADLDLSYAELEQGIIGGGGDGGLDSMFTFVNGELITEDFDFSAIKRSPEIEFLVMQSKVSQGFGETALDRATNTFRDIADLASTFEDLVDLYDGNFARRADCFREALVQLAPKHPRVSIRYVYATKGDTGEIGVSVRQRAARLKDAIEQDVRHADVSIEFVGAAELLDLVRAPRSYSIDVEFAEQFVSTARTNYVGLVRLGDLMNSLAGGEPGSLNRVLFDSNVRDFHGDVEVNQDIIASLASDDDGLDFWWLNNGITILGSDATSAGKKVTVRDAQVINGLQTTHSVHQYSMADPAVLVRDTRHALVKIVVTEDEAARDRIIKATNFQTPVPVASLRATDRLQRNIEEFLKQNGWFYDRRKNYYKNLGKKRDQIVSIPYLAQAVMSMAAKQPDQARARPSTLIKDEARYSALFSEDRPLQEYLYCVRTQRSVDAFLAAHSDKYSSSRRANIRFHIAMAVTGELAGSWPYYPDGFSRAAERIAENSVIAAAAEAVAERLDEFISETGWSEDRACKSKDFVQYVLSKPLENAISPS